MNQERVILNTCQAYLHCNNTTQVYVITGPKGSKIANDLKTVHQDMPNRAPCLLLPENKGFHVNSWPIDPKANMYEIFANIARSLRDMPEDRVVCAIVFGEHVDFFGD